MMQLGVLLKAVEAAGTTDYAKICEQLEKTNYDGITGHLNLMINIIQQKNWLLKLLKMVNIVI